MGVKTRELQERGQIQHAMLEASDQSILMLDMNGMILLANESAARRLKKDLNEFVGFYAWDLLPPEIFPSRKAAVDGVFKTGKSALLVDERDGIILESNIFPIFSSNGKVDRVVLFARDVTEQRRIEMALQASEEKYRLLAEASHDMIYVITEDHLIEYVNSYAAAQFNLGSEALVGKRQTTMFPTDFATHQKEGIASVLSSGSPEYSESWINFGEGKNAYVSTWLIPLKDQINGKRSILGVSRDITSIKRMQEELKLSHDQLEKRVEERTRELAEASAGMRRLAQKVIFAQEEERRKISRELHDDTGQVLVTLKYSLAELLKEMPSDHDVLEKRVSEAIKVVNEAMASTRVIAHSLRPPLLDAGGLNISLKEFSDDINRRTNIKVTYDGEEIEHLPEEITVTLYRVVQEAISNILKHSQATSVNVILTHIQKWVILSISDNGIGIHEDQKSTGIGLIGIRERVGYLGGELQINTSPGKGTVIRDLHPVDRTCHRIIGPDLKILVISMLTAGALVEALVDFGVRGYIYKDDENSIRQLPHVIKSVSEGGIFFSPEAWEKVKPGRSALILTGRQLEVLSVSAAYPDLPTAVLAQKLSISPSTFRNLLSGAYLRLGVSTRTAAIVRANQLGLLASASGLPDLTRVNRVLIAAD